MFLDRKLEELTKKYNDKVVVGMDLADDFSQISYCTIGSGEPVTLSMVNGEEEYRIPTVLGKKHGSGQWIFGKEALKLGKNGDVILLKDLVFLAEQGLPVVIEDLEYDVAKLLGVFIKRCIFLIGEVTSSDKLEAVVISLKEMSQQMLKALELAVTSMNLPKTTFYFVTHKESYFQYVLHQEKNLWMQDVVLFDYRNDGMQVFTMKMNHHTVPVVTFIEEGSYPNMRIVDLDNAREREAEAANLDSAFLTIAKECCEGKRISSVFLVGDGFTKEWCRESLKYLCATRRVFQGNNLYSKGACYLAIEKVIPSALMESYVYLAEDKLKSNLGIRVVREGQECYMTLLDAGTSWYEAKKECDFILEDDNRLPIIVTPMDGKNIKVAEIHLDGLHIHGKKTNRLHVYVSMNSVKTVHVTVSDMGFGELFPGSGHVWQEEFDIA